MRSRVSRSQMESTICVFKAAVQARNVYYKIIWNLLFLILKQHESFVRIIRHVFPKISDHFSSGNPSFGKAALKLIRFRPQMSSFHVLNHISIAQILSCLPGGKGYALHIFSFFYLLSFKWIFIIFLSVVSSREGYYFHISHTLAISSNAHKSTSDGSSTSTPNHDESRLCCLVVTCPCQSKVYILSRDPSIFVRRVSFQNDMPLQLAVHDNSRK